jgi:hypothetical protein
MLLLESRQLKSIELHMLEVLKQRLERVIATTFPELNAKAPDDPRTVPVSSIVKRGVDNAQKYGIEEDGDLAAFIALGLAWRTLPRETAADWIRSWLERPDLPGDTKLAIIEAQLADASGQPALAALAARVSQARREMKAA